jgi:hypothetical protein
MNAINILLACLGGGITLIVAVGMILLTPGGTEPQVQKPLEQPHAEAARSAPEPTGRAA